VSSRRRSSSSLAQLERRIVAALQAHQGAARQAALTIKPRGDLLARYKADAGHGHWLALLRRIGVHPRKAERFIEIAQNWSIIEQDIRSHPTRVSNLSQREMLKLIGCVHRAQRYARRRAALRALLLPKQIDLRCASIEQLLEGSTLVGRFEAIITDHASGVCCGRR